MPDYYTSDVTQMPYSDIFNGGGYSWPLTVRLLFAFRKAAGWHYPASYSRCAPETWRGLEMDELPATARRLLEPVIADTERHGFSLLGFSKSDTIGLQVGYSCSLIADDRVTVCTLTALRTGLKNLSRSALVIGLRSDLTSGTILVTGRGPKLPGWLIRPHQKIEMFPETTSVADLVRRHRERLHVVASEQLIHVPTEGITDYLLACAKRDWSDFMDTGMFRKLSTREVARLRDVKFDFE